MSEMEVWMKVRLWILLQIEEETEAVAAMEGETRLTMVMALASELDFA